MEVFEDKLIVYSASVPLPDSDGDQDPSLHREFKIGKKEPLVRFINLYFSYSDGHTNYSKGQPISQAELANILIIKGKWNRAFSSVLNENSDWWQNRLNDLLTRFLSNSVQILIKRRKRTLSRGKTKTIIDKFKYDIDFSRREYLEARDRRNEFREFIKRGDIELFAPKNLYGWYREEWISKETKELKRKLRDVEEAVKASRKAYLELKSKLPRKILATELYHMHRLGLKSDYASLKRILNNLDDEQEDVVREEFNGNTKAYERYRAYIKERISLIENPFLYGTNIKSVLNRVGKEMVNLVKDWILGAKAPDIADRTKRNRTSRGHDDEPPLNETGEFANSLKYEVI